MKRVLLWMVAITVAVLVAFGAWLGLSERGRSFVDAASLLVGSDEGVTLQTEAALVDYLAEHPDRWSLAAWEIGHEDAGLFHDADGTWPLASTVKVLPLALASERLADAGWSPEQPLPDVERYSVAGTDGDAHLKALRALDGGTRTLGNGLRAMIRFSDNAATDAVLFALGRPAVDDGAARFGLEPMHPLLGTLRLARAEVKARPTTVDDDAWQLAADRDAEPRRPSLDAQLAMTKHLDNRGSPRAFAAVMATLFSGDAAYATAREALSWPLEFETNRRDFRVLATKGGSLPGVLTSASYAETKDGRRRVVALFLHDLPFASWLRLTQSFTQQKLERTLLLDDGAFERLRPKLQP